MLRFLFVAFLFFFPSITFATPDMDSVKVGSFQSLGNEIALSETRAWFSLHFDVTSSIKDVSQLLGAYSWSV
ncbi:MAG TPA: hypothetical protein EYN06_09875 [Myxococcales bacterium]|nr:hypothetical protein [Myxococcales bacterium]